MQLLPDTGFACHPGKTQWGWIVEQAEKGKGTLWKALPGLYGPADYRRRKLGNIRPKEIGDTVESMLLSAGQSDASYRQEFIQRYGVEKIIRDTAGEPVVLSLRSFLLDKTPGTKETWKFSKTGHGESIAIMEEQLVNPYEIWLVPQKSKSGKVRLTKRYIGLWKTADKKRIGGLAVYEAVASVFTGVTNFVPMKKGIPDLGYLEKLRQGVLLYGR